jgi:beta-glucuronidase
MNGLWDFVFLGDVSANSIDVSSIKFNDSMAVPACFDATPTYAGRRGLAAYRTSARIVANTPSLLYFGSVSFWGQVFVDKQLLAEHSPSYYPFWVNVAPTSKTDRELIVLVDNRFNATTSVLQYPNFDFYQYGGINRDVYWYEVGSSFMQRVEVVGDMNGFVSLTLYISGNNKSIFNVAVDIETGVTETFTAKPNHGVLVLPQFSVNNAQLWSPSSPYLYNIKISLFDASNNLLDVHETRFGFRTVEAKNNAMYLNGKVIQLLGVNRHEAHPEFGPALPFSLLLSDIQLLKNLGVNYVRGAHYPQDPRWMDLCDQYGILLWVENIAWGYDSNLAQNPMFLPAQVQAMNELIDEAFNHPSIILYGFLNECPSDNERWTIIYSTLIDTIKQRKTGGLTTYASNRGQNDINMGLVDVASFNTYPGWYDNQDIGLDELLSHITREMDSLQNWAAKKHPGKPVTISEIGAGAIYGWRDELNGFWTEAYQSEYVSLAMGHVVNNPQRFSGISLWQFFDIRTYSGARDLGRPKGFNNKGLLNANRKPKQSYWTIQKLLRN